MIIEIYLFMLIIAIIIIDLFMLSYCYLPVHVDY